MTFPLLEHLINLGYRRTRTSTPAPVTGDDIGMSTGDESDDADLTDSDSVGDSWSDTEGEDPLIKPTWNSSHIG